jgi:hypothetical protein
MLVVMIYSGRTSVTYTCMARLGVLLLDTQDSLHMGHRKQQLVTLLYTVSIEDVRPPRSAKSAYNGVQRCAAVGGERSIITISVLEGSTYVPGVKFVAVGTPVHRVLWIYSIVIIFLESVCLSICFVWKVKSPL